MQSLDYWSALGGGYVLEWWEGPNAHEVYEKLIDELAESASLLLQRSDFVERTDLPCDDREHRVFLLIRDVPVEFRSCQPVGFAVAQARSWERVRRTTRPDS